MNHLFAAALLALATLVLALEPSERGPRAQADQEFGEIVFFHVATENFDSVYRLATINADGSDERIVTTTQTFGSAPQRHRVAADGSYSASARASMGITQEAAITLWDPAGERLEGFLDVPAPGSGVTHFDPAWPPSGAFLAFSSNQVAGAGPRSSIVRLDLDGSGAVKLTTPPSDRRDGQPDWSPDGSLIVFERRATMGPESDIYAVPSMGGAAFPLRTGGTNRSPRYSPDGTMVAFVGGISPRTDLWVMGADGSNPRNLLEDLNGDLTVAGFDWSPDSTEIAVITLVGDFPNTESTLRVATVATGALRTLVSHSATGGDPRWSPSGGLIAYWVSTNPLPSVRVIHPDGTGGRLLAPGSRPEWNLAAFGGGAFKSTIPGLAKQ